MQAQLVADGGSHHVAGRHLAFGAVAAHGLHRGVGAAVDLVAVDVEVVAADAVEGGRGSGIGRGVANGGHRGHVVDETVVAGEALVDKAAEASVGLEAVVVAREIVPPHLVHHNAHHEAWALAKMCLRLGREGRAARQYQE